MEYYRYPFPLPYHYRLAIALLFALSTFNHMGPGLPSPIAKVVHEPHQKFHPSSPKAESEESTPYIIALEKLAGSLRQLEEMDGWVFKQSKQWDGHYGDDLGALERDASANINSRPSLNLSLNPLSDPNAVPTPEPSPRPSPNFNMSPHPSTSLNPSAMSPNPFSSPPHSCGPNPTKSSSPPANPSPNPSTSASPHPVAASLSAVSNSAARCPEAPQDTQAHPPGGVPVILPNNDTNVTSEREEMTICKLLERIFKVCARWSSDSESKAWCWCPSKSAPGIRTPSNRSDRRHN